MPFEDSVKELYERTVALTAALDKACLQLARDSESCPFGVGDFKCPDPDCDCEDETVEAACWSKWALELKEAE